MRHLLWPLTIGSVLLCSTPLFAGEIRLSNGDLLSGEIQSLTDGNVIWNSSSFGELTVPVANIIRLQSSQNIGNLVQGGRTYHDCTIAIENGMLQTDCQNATAQFASSDAALPTTEKEPAKATSGEVKAAFSKQKGNTDSSSLDFATKATYQGDVVKQVVVANADREENAGITNKEYYTFDYRADYPISEQWVAFGRTGYEKDRFASIDERYEVGSGFGYRPTFSPNLLLELNLGADYAVNDYQNGDSEEGMAGHWSMNAEWVPGILNLTIFHTNDYTWPLRDSNDYRIKTSTGIKIPLLTSLFAEIRYDYDYQNIILTGTNASDSEWVFSVGYGW